MQITLLTEDRDAALAFEEGDSSSPSSPLKVESVVELPGAAAGGWYEVCLAWGALGVPAAVIANIASQYIWDVWRSAKPTPPTVKLKMVLREGDRVSEIDLETQNISDAEEAIARAVEHVRRP